MIKHFGNHRQRGTISIFVLVFGVVAAVAIAGLVLVAGVQYTAATRTDAFEKALTIAQSGAEYYRWHLAHNPTDLTDGTTGNPGPYVHQMTDPYGNTNGSFSLTITPAASGSSIITVTSQGWTAEHPEVKRTVTTKYGIPSVGEFSFLENANMWFGTRTTIYGPVYSNGGIRMDGTNLSTIQSAKSTYTCGTETGCDPAETKPGVWGAGGPQNLWSFPMSTIDFSNIVVDYTTMKTIAQQSGIYLGPSGSYGYHLTFNSNGTVTVKKITKVTSEDGWSVETGCEDLYETIKTEQTVGTYAINGKPIIFAEDHLWVDGVVNGRISVAAARFPIDVNKMNIWIDGNITYPAKDGVHALGLVAQNDIYLALDVPQDTEVDALLLAQSGRIIRHNYKYQGCSNGPKAVRQSLTIYGSVISNGKSYWSYGNGPVIGYGNEPTSGFKVVTITVDPNMTYTPPPYFPTYGALDLISWEEK